jgi:hypothetical protein
MAIHKCVPIQNPHFLLTEFLNSCPDEKRVNVLWIYAKNNYTRVLRQNK